MRMPRRGFMKRVMRLPRSLIRTTGFGAAAAALLVANLARPQPSFYQTETRDRAGTSLQEQMPQAPDRPKSTNAQRAKPKLRPATSARAAQPQSPQNSTTAADACTSADNVLGTSRTIAIGAPNGLQVGLKTYPQTIKLEDHEVVLTFDDGPLPATTGKVLDALKAQCVKATFFLIGQNAPANPRGSYGRAPYLVASVDHDARSIR
jgi:hypothetical protein